MNLKIFSFLFTFSREQRMGLFLLFSIIILLQILYVTVDFTSFSNDVIEKKQWIALQKQIDSLKNEQIHQPAILYPFNPNFITDYKGAKLGMSVAEIDRLHAYRKLNKYVNSTKDFQEVTRVSNELLRSIAPYFKFPDWINKKKQITFSSKYNSNKSQINKKELIDINEATQSDLVAIYGIGEVLASRVLKFREALGAMTDITQIEDIWGLSNDVKQNLYTHFAVIKMPKLKKIAINNASIKELSEFPYFNYQIARQIVIYRSMNGDFKTSEDLTKIKGLSNESAKIIALYLDF